MTDSETPAKGNANNERFNAEAATWDEKPFIKEVSLKAWKAIQTHVPSFFNGTGQKPDVLEIGCGTGLLSFEMAPVVNRLVAVDAAEGMVEVLERKLQRPESPKNITALAILLEDPEDKRLPPADESKPDGPRLKYDLITSHLVLHHIADLKQVLTTMLGCLKENGMVALTDFEDFGPEARRFHPVSKMDGVERHGINREWMSGLMNEVGFKNVQVTVAWEHLKRVERYPGEFQKGNTADGEGEMMNFPYIICLGQKA